MYTYVYVHLYICIHKERDRGVNNQHPSTCGKYVRFLMKENCTFSIRKYFMKRAFVSRDLPMATDISHALVYFS